MIVVRETKAISELYKHDRPNDGSYIEIEPDGTVYRTYFDNYNFCEWLFNLPVSTTVVAHNGGKYDCRFIVNYLLMKGIKPNIILQGNNIKRLCHKKVTVLDSYAHIPVALRQFTGIFGLEETKKGFFPLKLVSTRNNGYIGSMPGKEWFYEDAKEFHDWYDKQPKDLSWSYDRELYEYCKSDVKLLYEGCEKFRKMFREVTGSDPFAYVTCASHCQAIYTTLFMPNDSIPIMQDEFNEHYKSSRKEKQWIKFMEDTKSVRIQSQYRLDKCVVDGYDGKNVYMFYGCYWHGCRQCYPSGTNTVNRQSFAYLYAKTMGIHEKLCKRGNVIYIWEHDFDKLAKLNKMPMIDDSDLPLNARKAMFGGRTETFTAYKQGGQIQYADFVSLYPTVNKYDRYPSGNCTVLKNPIKWNNDWVGFATVTVTPPPNLYIPVLPCRGEKLTFDLEPKTGTWVCDEITYALAMGYKIDKIHKAMIYDKVVVGLFKDYVDTFMKIKLEASGFPKKYVSMPKNTPKEDWHLYVSDENKQKYLEYVQNTSGISIDIDKVKYNAGLRFIAKLCLNSLWGKFGQNLDRDDVIYVNNELDYLKYFEKMRRYEILNDKMVFMKISGSKKPTFRTTMCVAAYTTAHARIRLHKLMTGIINQGGTMYYCDTDSVIFEDAVITTGDALGEVANELDADEYIETFVSVGAKAYAYKTNQDKKTIKLKGIPEKHRSELYDTMIRLIKGELQNIKVQTGVTFQVNKLHEMQTRETHKTVTKTLNKRHFFDDGTSLPYGHERIVINKDDVDNDDDLTAIAQ
jgi:hypothetical protein